jgi:hypothetical protein
LIGRTILKKREGLFGTSESGQVISQEGFDRLPQGVVPIEITLVGETIDLRFRDLYQGQVAPPARSAAWITLMTQIQNVGWRQIETFLRPIGQFVG